MLNSIRDADDERGGGLLRLTVLVRPSEKDPDSGFYLSVAGRANPLPAVQATGGARRHALGVAEQFVRIVLLLDRHQAGEIVAPIGGGVILQIEIAIIHVGRAGHMRPHRGIHLATCAR